MNCVDIAIERFFKVRKQYAEFALWEIWNIIDILRPSKQIHINCIEYINIL